MNNGIKDYYNTLFHKVMKKYEIYGNTRINLATEKALEYVDSDSYILDIGCGIGITSNVISYYVKEGHVWGFDISESNINYAKENKSNQSVTFFQSDITKDNKKIASRIPNKIDVILIIDVIEHIPKKYYSDFFKMLKDICHADSVILVSYPSPQFQQYLRNNYPDKQQPIDQKLYPKEVFDVAMSEGFQLKFLDYKSVEFENQYIYLTFTPKITLSERYSDDDSTVVQFMRWVTQLYRENILIPIRKREYMENVYEVD